MPIGFEPAAVVDPLKHGSDVRPSRRSPGGGRVGLVPLDAGLGVLRRHEPDLVAKSGQLPNPDDARSSKASIPTMQAVS